jgi:hypothetical protein
MRTKTGQKRFPWTSSESARLSKWTGRHQLVYSEPLRIPGELLTPTADPVEPTLLITEYRQHMARLRPVPAARHAFPATCVYSDLEKCTQVFLRQDTTRRALEPPCSGPHQVLSRREKTLQLLVRGRPVIVSADRVKPAYMLSGTDRGSSSFNPPADGTPTVAQPATARYTHYTLWPPHPFPCLLQHLSIHFREGGVMWEPPTVQRALPNRRSKLQLRRPLVSAQK